MGKEKTSFNDRQKKIMNKVTKKFINLKKGLQCDILFLKPSNLQSLCPKYSDFIIEKQFQNPRVFK